MKTYNDIKQVNETEVIKLFKENIISLDTFEEYYKKTSIYKRNLINNSVWDILKKQKL